MNIRYSEANKWLGLVGEDAGFCVFEHEDYSFRAAFILLKNYGRKGFRTVHSIVQRYAPPSENPTDKYVSFVCDKMQGLGYEAYGVEFKDSSLDLSNDMVVADLIYCMVLFESGKKYQLTAVMAALKRMGCISTGDDEPIPVPTILR